MIILPVMIAALVTASDPAPAEPAANPPASEAVIDRFLAAMPPAARLGTPDPSLDSAALDGLAELNPGRIEEIRPILAAEAACEAPLWAAMTARALRGVARGLGDDKLDRLIRFYQGDDFRLFDGLAERLGKGESLSQGEQAEFDRILAAYPVAEFAQRVQGSGAAMLEDPAMDELIRCAADRRAALEARGLRLYPVLEE